MNVAFSPGITESRTIQITCPRSILRPESVPASLTLNHLRLCENICFILVFSSSVRCSVRVRMITFTLLTLKTYQHSRLVGHASRPTGCKQ